MLVKREAGFIALQDGINTETSGGRLVFHIMGAFVEFERSLISERTTAGLASVLGVHRNTLRRAIEKQP